MSVKSARFFCCLIFCFLFFSCVRQNDNSNNVPQVEYFPVQQPYYAAPRYAPPVQPYSRYYSNPYAYPNQNYYYDSDQYYVPPQYYQGREQEGYYQNRSNGFATGPGDKY